MDDRLAASLDANLEAVIEAVPGGVVVISTTGAIVRANAEATRILGISWDALSRRFVSDFEPETLNEDGSPCPASDYPVSRCLQTGKPQPAMTLGIRRPDGAIAWAVFRATPLKDQEGKELLGAVVTFIDVTESRQTATALRDSAEQLRAFFENTPDYILIVDEDARILFINRVVSGLTYETVIGTPCYDYMPKEPDARRLAEAIRLALEEGKSSTYETATAEHGVFVSRVVPIEYGGQRAVMQIATDVTEQRKAEQAKRELEARMVLSRKLESLGVLAGGVAHDFSNLLVGILGRVDLAERELPDESPARCHLADLRAAAQQAAELTDHLLAFSGKGSFVQAPQDLNTLIRDLRRLLEVAVPESVSVQFELQDDLPGLMADATQIRQVLMNLVRNAADAITGSKEGGVITIRTRIEESHAAPKLVFEVSDDGPGIPQETVSQIFDPFFSTKEAGRGLGLATALGLVRGHGGTLEVRTSKDEGTTFRATLPCLDHQVDPTPMTKSPSTTGPCVPDGEGVVLVVDDEAHVRRVLRIVLEEQGFEVLAASDGVEALRLFRERMDEVRVVVVDLLMPGMGGEEVLAELHALRPKLPVILTSGYAKDVATRRIGDAGLAGFLKKPFRLEELTSLVGKLTKRR